MSDNPAYAALMQTIADMTEMNDGNPYQPDVTAVGHARIYEEPETGVERFLSFHPGTVNFKSEFGTAAVIGMAKTDGPMADGLHYLGDEQLNEIWDLYGPVRDDGNVHKNMDALGVLHEQLMQDSFSHELDFAPGHRNVPVVIVINDLSKPPQEAADAFLRLILLSKRFVQPNELNLGEIFGKLENVAWTNQGAIAMDVIEQVLFETNAFTYHDNVNVTVNLVDKFPRMLDFVIPGGVRVADSNRVRLGAHLAEGTTVMHEGFCNFNAGTLGKAMIEGRISAGVVIGAGSDVGGGVSTMGTLSGGGKQKISIGENCLLGANSGLGIPLGDNCTVEAGLYLTAGTVVSMPDGTTKKALDLAGVDGLLFRRHSQKGNVEAIEQEGGSNWNGLNSALHDNG